LDGSFTFQPNPEGAIEISSALLADDGSYIQITFIRSRKQDCEHGRFRPLGEELFEMPHEVCELASAQKKR
jgi:hypothetical protein